MRPAPRVLVVLAGLLACHGGGRGGDEGSSSGAGSETGASSGGTGGEVPGACAGEDFGPRQLRLLTRREYDQTIRDLFALPPGAGCEGDACAGPPQACARAFSLPAAGQSWSAVHVAGSFNAWAGSVAAGGWPLTYDAVGDAWRGEFSFDPGTYAYKFVADGATWLPDPNNPDTAPDGFGGVNSVLVHTCPAGQPEPFSPSSLLPPETRPEGFAFDNNAAAGLVTAVHADGYLRAAERVAEVALQHREGWLACAPGDAAGCAAAFSGEFLGRAFRRPPSAEERQRYEALVTGQGELDAGLRVALQAALISPNFLYRSEVGDASGRLDSHEVASALSYTLWGTMPDAALRARADAGELAGPEAVADEATRMLADPRARAAIGAFAVQWLGVEPILTADKSAALFPDLGAALRRSMVEETRRFVTHVILDAGGAPGELFTADYSFLDPGLSDLYGAPGGAVEFPRTSLPASRAGLLGHASVLGTYAHSDQSSPIRRGLFVRRSLLCQELGNPPPNAGGVPEVDPNATTRERFRQHSADDFCRACHQYIDELGFGFERFDAIGRWREQENGLPIESGGDMNDVEALGEGTHAPYQDLRQLGALLAGAESPRACLARQVFRFSRGVREGVGDACALDAMTDVLRESDDIRALIVAALSSPGFLQRR